MITIPELFWPTLSLALILALTAGMFLVVRKLMGQSGNDRQNASELLTNFKELHARGGLSDDEYRTIKTKLAPELSAEMANIAGDSRTISENPESHTSDGLEGPHQLSSVLGAFNDPQNQGTGLNS